MVIPTCVHHHVLFNQMGCCMEKYNNLEKHAVHYIYIYIHIHIYIYIYMYRYVACEIDRIHGTSTHIRMKGMHSAHKGCL